MDRDSSDQTGDERPQIDTSTTEPSAADQTNGSIDADTTAEPIVEASAPNDAPADNNPVDGANNIDGDEGTARVRDSAEPEAHEDERSASGTDKTYILPATYVTESTPSTQADPATPQPPDTPLVGDEDHGITAEHVTRKVGKTTILDDVSFVARPGEITALVGPNGAGKTTLMLMLASLLSPTSGTIRVDGFDPKTNARALRPHLGWMPDTIGIWPNLSPRQSLRATARLYGLSGSEAKRRTEELLRSAGLDALAKRATKTLSRGQRQRLSFARALVHDPDVLVLDEPMSGLDPEARVAMRTSLRRLADAGKTILLSSHVIAELEELADAVVYLTHGRTVDAEQLQELARQQAVWRIDTLDPEVAKARLQALNIPFAEQGQRILVELDGDEAAAQLNRRLVEAGVDVAEYRRVQGTIESMVLQLAATETEQAPEGSAALDGNADGDVKA